MLRRRMGVFAGILTLALSLSVHAQNFGAGSCSFPATQMFPTIQLAVNTVPPGSTIFVCPGLYPEQVTISKPLTLQGRALGNANRATITMNPDLPIVPNLGNAYAQLLVTKVAPPGPVNITGITIDGNTGTAVSPPNCQAVSSFVAIYYDSGTTGTVNEVATRNQNTGGYCGVGIWAENDSDSNQPLTIENNSTHDFDWRGIEISNNLTATVHHNFLSGFAGGVAIENGASASITDNFEQGTSVFFDGIFLFNSATVNMLNNTIADGEAGLNNLEDTPVVAQVLTAQTNRVSNVQWGFLLQSGHGAVPASSAPSILGNLVQNTAVGVEFGFVTCPTSTTVDNNQFNDSKIALDNAPASLTGNNQFANIDTITVPGSCP